MAKPIRPQGSKPRMKPTTLPVTPAKIDEIPGVPTDLPGQPFKAPKPKAKEQKLNPKSLKHKPNKQKSPGKEEAPDKPSKFEKPPKKEGTDIAVGRRKPPGLPTFQGVLPKIPYAPVQHKTQKPIELNQPELPRKSRAGDPGKPVNPKSARTTLLKKPKP